MKNYRKLLNENRNLKKHIKIQDMIRFIGSLIILIMLLYAIFIQIKSYPEELEINNKILDSEKDIIYKKLNEIKIDYDDLDDNEIKITNDLLMQLKPQYLEFTKNITFTKNRSLLTHKHSKRSPNITGLNIGNGKHIYIWYRDSKKMKITICHEFLHNFFRKIDLDLEEELVRDIAKYGVCYK